MSPVFWIGVSIVFLSIEVFVPRKGFWSVGMGALFAGAAQLVGVEALEVQTGLFAVISGILLILMRTAEGKYLETASPHLRMNAAALPGQSAVALTDLAPADDAGRVRLRGMEWLAKPADDRAIPAGSRVRVVAISGITLVVRIEGR